jgi:hypothetical protein
VQNTPYLGYVSTCESKKRHPHPYTLREPEPELPTADQIAAAQQAKELREAQLKAGERAKADKAARARRIA